MKNDPTNERRNGLFFSLAALGLIATLVCTLPLFSMTQASVSDSDQAPDQITRSHQPGFENYDVRRDKKAKEKLEGFRAASGRNSLSISNEIQKMRTGEASLRNRIPTLQVEYNSNLNNAEVIAPDVKQGKSFLTDVAGASKDAETLRLFVKENCELVGFNASQADDLIVTADYTNPNGILSFASLEQKINGIPVFLGEVKAGFDRKGRMFRVINNLAPGLDYQSLSSEFGDPAEAVRNAFKHVPREIKPEDQALSAADSTDLKVKFGTGDWATVSEKMYFPTEPGVARAAWRILEWEPVAAYLVIVDAETGTMLWRKNITNDQTQSATYNVYANSTSMIKALDGPAPLTPGPISPNLGTQGTQVARTNVTLIGNEAPNTFNNLGWITDGANGGNGLTDGNNVQAGLDIASPDGIDSSVAGTNRVFSFNYNPPPGLGGATPDGATSATSRSGAVTQLFYLNNRYHDELYKLGFTEAAKNFQNDNFGRGGAAGDRVSAEAQDFSGTNNANFAVPPDGFRGKMQMYRFTQTPSRDGDLDADVVLHEHTHGLSNRLHGNGSGLSNGVAGSMGEGWSDFYALSLLSEPTDPVNGIYSTGSYVTFNIFGIGSTNSYYGIRRFPYAPIGFTGGPSNRPHNPLTFKDIDPAQASIGDGAYQASPGFAGNPANEVHNAGEVWCSALVEVRAKLISSAGGNVAVGNLKALQFVTDGMKLAPPTPTFLQERDAIVAGALNSGTAQDVADIWAGFAARGMGFSARQNSGSFTVVEAFDLANLVQTPTFAVSDPAGNNNGYPDPGETIALTVPLTNSTGRNATGVTLQIVGSGNFTFYGNIANGQTVSNSLISYTIPANTPCGSSITLTFDVNSNLGPTSFTRSITVGAPIVTATENFDGVTAPALPSGWTTTQTGAGVGFVTITNSADTAPNSVFTPDLTTTGGGAEITSPAFPISAAAGTVSFHHKYDTEAGWDGGVLEISIGGGAFQDIIAAGGTFVTGGYNGVLGAGVGNPLANRDAWSGDSGGYVTSTAQLPATANGQTVRFRWRFGADNNTVGNGANPGWNVDSITITGNYTCSSGLPVAKSRADFDGDGKTDVSVFRAGTWFVQRSTAGFAGVQWGSAGDTTVPGDYDGDNKTDFAIFRPSAASGVADFYVINSATSTFSGVEWGNPGDIPVIGDYTGDGKADFAIVRPSTYTWYILPSNGGSPIIGTVGQVCDRPVVGDFDGDGKTDIAGIQGSTWFIRNSTTNTITSTQWGLNSDKFVPADYDNDNKDDLAVFRAGNWYVRKSTDGQLLSIAFGQAGDIPVPGDYDGDGADDAAVFRNGNWYILGTTNGFQAVAFGLTGDTPIPSRYLP